MWYQQLKLRMHDSPFFLLTVLKGKCFTNLKIIVSFYFVPYWVIYGKILKVVIYSLYFKFL